jgi:hypothetical protein
MANWRLHCGRGWPAHSGQNISPGSFSAWGPHPRRTVPSPQPSWCLAHCCPSLRSSSGMQSLLQSTSWQGLEGWRCEPPCHWHMQKWPPSHPWPWWRPATYIRHGGAITPLAPLYAGPYKVVARQVKFQAGDWWPAGDSDSGQVESSPGTGPCGLSHSSGPWTANSRRTRLQTLTPGTIFPGMPAKFFAHPGGSRWRWSLAGGYVAAYIIIVLYVV